MGLYQHVISFKLALFRCVCVFFMSHSHFETYEMWTQSHFKTYEILTQSHFKTYGMLTPCHFKTYEKLKCHFMQRWIRTRDLQPVSNKQPSAAMRLKALQSRVASRTRRSDDGWALVISVCWLGSHALLLCMLFLSHWWGPSSSMQRWILFVCRLLQKNRCEKCPTTLNGLFRGYPGSIDLTMAWAERSASEVAKLHCWFVRLNSHS